jgi:ankyrin repeat protein
MRVNSLLCGGALLCLVGCAAYHGDGEDPKGHAKTSTDDSAPAAGPATPAPRIPAPAPAAPAAIVTHRPEGSKLASQWDASICSVHFAMSLSEAYAQHLFDDNPTTEAAPPTHCAALEQQTHVNSALQRLIKQLKPQATGVRRLLRSILVKPELLQEEDANGQTLVFRLTEKDELSLLEALFAYNSSLASAQDRFQRTPFYYVTSVEAADLLLRYNPPNQIDVAGETPVSFLTRHGQGQVVKYLISDAPNLCRQGSHWITRGYYWITDWWANVLNLPNLAGQSVVHAAALAGDPLVMHALASCPEVDIGVKDKNNRTLLHYAALHSDFATGYAALVSGTRGVDAEYPATASSLRVDVNTQDVNGDTALHFAYRCHNTQAIAFLITSFFADPARANASGWRADDPRSIQLGCPEFKL